MNSYNNNDNSINNSVERCVFYTLNFSCKNAHMVDVDMCFVAGKDPVLYLPTWLAGSYLIREFAKNVTAVDYFVIKQGDAQYRLFLQHLRAQNCMHDINASVQMDAQSPNAADGALDTSCAIAAENTATTQWTRAKKIDKNHWQLIANTYDLVCVRYSVYCFDLSVRTAYIDHARIFANFSSLLLTTDTPQNTRPCCVNLLIPKAFFNTDPAPVLASALDYKKQVHNNFVRYSLNHQSTLDLYDHPFEISAQVYSSFEVIHKQKRYVHDVFITGAPNTDLKRLCQDLQKICSFYIAQLDFVPFERYAFLTHATENEYGGLEHTFSTALVIPMDNLPMFDEAKQPSDKYQEFLGLCSHEYFHAWWVKSVRDVAIKDCDFNAESYSTLLWVFEGFTSYIDDYALYKACVIDKKAYLALLQKQIARYYQNAGRHIQSVEESSFDAWIKLYRPDENSTNTTTSYYNKGALLALCLDLMLLQKGHRLLDVVRYFVQKIKNGVYYLDKTALKTCLSDMLGKAECEAFFSDYIEGVKPLPLVELLNKNGVTLTLSPYNDIVQKPFGLNLSEQNGVLTIRSLPTNHPISQTGLSAKDTIVAIDGMRASLKVAQQCFLHAKYANTDVRIHAFRKHKLHEFIVSADLIANMQNYSDEQWAYLEQTGQSAWLNA